MSRNLVSTGVLFIACILFYPPVVWAAGDSDTLLDLTNETTGYLAIVIFVLAYLVVMAEEFTHLRKSKPVILAAGIIWAIIAYRYSQESFGPVVEEAVRHNLLEYAELMLFLLAAMTYVNAMEERLVFQALRAWLVARGWQYRTLFWITGFLAFFLSPIIDNLTTAVVMCAVLLAVGKNNPRFISLGCINIVVAANAGGAFSPFGDITTLMVWQKGLVEFWTFFLLFIPSVVNYVIPAACMSFAVPQGLPSTGDSEVRMRRGAITIIFLFGCTIATAVSFHNFLHLPPFLGMMTGLAYLKFFGYYLKKTHKPVPGEKRKEGTIGDIIPPRRYDDDKPFDIFTRASGIVWMLCANAMA